MLCLDHFLLHVRNDNYFLYIFVTHLCLMDELRNESKNNKLLNNIIMSVSKSSIADLNENSKVLKK